MLRRGSGWTESCLSCDYFLAYTSSKCATSTEISFFRRSALTLLLGGFTDLPNGLARINFGERSIDVTPTPGHNETEVSFYYGSTGLCFSGDFLMPERLLVDDANAYLTSAKRVAAFVSDRPVKSVHSLGSEA